MGAWGLLTTRQRAVQLGCETGENEGSGCGRWTAQGVSSNLCGYQSGAQGGGAAEGARGQGLPWPHLWGRAHVGVVAGENPLWGQLFPAQSNFGHITGAFDVLCMYREILLNWKTNTHGMGMGAGGVKSHFLRLEKPCAESKKRKHHGEMESLHEF